MFKKFVIGLALVTVACSIAGSGYAFGKYLKQRESTNAVIPASQGAVQEAPATPASN